MLKFYFLFYFFRSDFRPSLHSFFVFVNSIFGVCGHVYRVKLHLCRHNIHKILGLLCSLSHDSLVVVGAERASQLSSHRILTRMYMYFRLQNINHGVISNIIENDDRSVKINGSKSYQGSVRKIVVSFHALIMYQVNWWVDTVINTSDYKCNIVIKIGCVFFCSCLFSHAECTRLYRSVSPDQKTNYEVGAFVYNTEEVEFYS